MRYRFLVNKNLMFINRTSSTEGLGWVGLGWVLACAEGGVPRPLHPYFACMTGPWPWLPGLIAVQSAGNP